MDDEKIATLCDTILFIWNNAENLKLAAINRLIQELIEVIEKEDK